MKTRWREVKNEDGRLWQFWNGLVVYGTIFERENGLYLWSARILEKYRMNADAPHGLLPKFDDAKTVVEYLCNATDTPI